MAFGNYHWRVRAYFPYDENSANDTVNLPVQVSLSRPSQLRAASLTADAQATSTNPIAQIRWSVVNDGDGPAGYNWVDSVYYSSDVWITPDDTLLASRTNLAGLASGARYSWQTSVSLPGVAKTGGFLLLYVDNNQVFWEEIETDNFIDLPLRITPEKPGPTWLTEPRFMNGRFQASLHGVAGQSVVLQASTNLIDWESLRALTFQTEELDIEDINSGGSAPRFYRLIPLSELD
ncbi:hypothetical protein SDC9_113011 [bioreactor metagenome]|uniref:CARDB domain-containing protein n=1 Tax=bioreactor metagenome TaxID=1076179 RepID=A0A645BWG2_9ZZZZ